VIALKPACARRDALMVVLFNPRKDEAIVHRVWPVAWRGLVTGFLVALAVLAVHHGWQR
jgi:hypothetical protein